MKVGLNLLFLVPGETGGMETYARGLCPALAAAGADPVAFINRETERAAPDWLAPLRCVTVPVRSRSRVEWVRGEQALLPRLARSEGIDLLHSLGSTAPAWGRFRRVVTVHDLIYRRFPQAHRGLRSLGMRMLVPLAARRADRVIAPSQATRADLVELLGLAADRIDVVPEAVGEVGAGLAEDVVRTRLGLGSRPLLLTLSARRRHKNLEALIDALATIPAQRRPLLVLPGYVTGLEDSLLGHARAAGVAEDVRFLGWLDDELLEGLWRSVAGFVFPSVYEGFGLPVLEAMARGVPVACSDAASLPEVAGDAALLFDPHDRAAIAAAIERLPAEASRLREAGLAQAARFSWEHSARLTLQSYERAF